MAKPIEPTPVLTGKDAEEFINDILNARYSEKKARFLKEAEEAYEKYIEKKQ